MLRTDRQTDLQTDIVTYRAAITAKKVFQIQSQKAKMTSNYSVRSEGNLKPKLGLSWAKVRIPNLGILVHTVVGGLDWQIGCQVSLKVVGVKLLMFI